MKSKINVARLNSLSGHRDAVYALEHLGDSSKFFSAAGDGMVVLWDLDDPENGKLVARVPNSVYSICLDPTSNILMVGHNYEGVHFIDWEHSREIGNIKCTAGSIFSMVMVGELLVIGDSNGELHSIDFKKGRIVQHKSLTDKSIRTLVYNEELHLLVAGTSDHTIYLLDPVTWQVIQRLEGHANSVFTARFDADNNYLLTAGRDAHIMIWDVHNGYALHKDIVAHMYTINNLEFSPDGKHFVTCSMDKSIKVWDTKSFDLLKVIDKSRHAGHGTSVNKLLWKSYNDTLLSASDDRTISSWQLKFNII